ncbi:hypothetical protein SLS58_008430 [Diplodia intermedia]|uniref:Uncharacterized protein n=1 Tax=Diplodia intermedia TaxID=856260 RepID=A0ABR3THL9_9PEZI
MASTVTDPDSPFVVIPNAQEISLRHALAHPNPKLKIVWVNVKTGENCSILVSLHLFRVLTAGSNHTMLPGSGKGTVPNYSFTVTLGYLPGSTEDMEFLFRLLTRAARITKPNDGVYAILKPLDDLFHTFRVHRILIALKVPRLCEGWASVVNRWMFCGVPCTGPELVTIWTHFSPDHDALQYLHANVAYHHVANNMPITADPHAMDDLELQHFLTLMYHVGRAKGLRDRYPAWWAHQLEENWWRLQDFAERLTPDLHSHVALAKDFHPKGRLDY